MHGGAPSPATARLRVDDGHEVHEPEHDKEDQTEDGESLQGQRQHRHPRGAAAAEPRRERRDEERRDASPRPGSDRACRTTERGAVRPAPAFLPGAGPACRGAEGGCDRYGTAPRLRDLGGVPGRDLRAAPRPAALWRVGVGVRVGVLRPREVLRPAGSGLCPVRPLKGYRRPRVFARSAGASVLRFAYRGLRPNFACN